MEYTVSKPETGFAGLSIELINDSRIHLSSPNDAKNTNPGTGGSFSILLKEDLSEDFRDTTELTEIMDSLREKIQFDEIPHFTTIQKFCQRIQSSPFTWFLNRLMKLFYEGYHGPDVGRFSDR
jgi:hypothetical protein